MSLPRFGVQHPVPANLLMAILLVGGLFASTRMVREFFPETSPESATIRVPYPGATPEEIEESLVRKIEDAIVDLDEVEQVSATITEGSAQLIVEFLDGVDADKATDEVERAVDALTDLPEDAERMTVTQFEPRLPVIMVSVFGLEDEDVLKQLVRRVHDDLRQLDGMGEAVRSGVRDYEIRVDVDADALLAHGLSLPLVADAISAWMADVPGGTVRTEVGNINLRLMGVPERSSAIGEIVLRADDEGTAIRVSDVAAVREYFVDEQIKQRFSTREISGPSANLTVYKVGDQDAVRIAEMVRAYVRGRRAALGDETAAFEMRWHDRVLVVASKMQAMRAWWKNPDAAPPLPMKSPRLKAYELGLAAPPLPDDCSIATSSDLARFIEGRLDLLVRNARAGAVLVILTLLLFLNWRTAWWVTVGLGTSLAGTLLFMFTVGVTLNLLTMFGLIVVLGLLVDDAIVVAENVTARHERGEPALSSAIGGTEQVFWPVVATVLTSIVAFMPLHFITGQIGDLLGALPWVVTCALIMSLIESVVILPSHMGHSLRHRDRLRADRKPSIFQRFEARRDRWIMDGLVPAYGRVLDACIRYRYICVSLAIAVFTAGMGVIVGGRLEFEFLSSSDSETIICDVTMPIGTPLERTQDLVSRIEAAAIGQEEVRTVSALLGVSVSVDDTSGVMGAGRGTHQGQLFIELLPVESRERTSQEVTDAIRVAAGPMPDADSIAFSEVQGGPGGKDITVQVSGNDEAVQRAVVEEIKVLLAGFAGVFDISDDDAEGQREVQVELQPGAAAMGFTVANVARQVRGALYGLEPHVFSAKEEDIDVRVRLDERSRRSLHSVENMWVVAPDGRQVPLVEIAELREGTSYNAIRRIDRRRTISVTADTHDEVSPETLVPELVPAFRELERQHPGIRVELGGRQRQLRKAFESLPIGFGAAMLLIYLILAWLFASYLQPLAVMIGIPFGLIGVIIGHMLLGYDLTFLSVIGFVALSGIVVNDSLILVEFYNAGRARGESVEDALRAAGRQRLRPILLTTITTVLGLTPLMLEQSFQAKFLIPMAVSIAFGLMSATLLILLVLPAILVILDDLKAAAHYLWYGLPRGTRDAAVRESD